MPAGQLRGQETTNGMQCCRSLNQRPQSESAHKAQMPCPPPANDQMRRWRRNPSQTCRSGHSHHQRQENSVLGGGGQWRGQLAWESNSWSSSETLVKSLPPRWPTSLRHKTGSWRTWEVLSNYPLVLQQGLPSSSPKDSTLLGPRPTPQRLPTHPLNTRAKPQQS